MKMNPQCAKAFLTLGLLLSLAINAFPVSAAEDGNVIVPGIRIGRIDLGMTREEVHRILGKPQHADAAMGKAFETWGLSGKAEFSVYFERDYEGHRTYVRQIRTTSPDYIVSDKKLSVASKVDEIWKAFPNTAYVSALRGDSSNAVEVYADCQSRDCLSDPTGVSKPWRVGEVPGDYRLRSSEGDGIVAD
ncbi:MAG: hypothetical protein M3463_01245 [Verrucomicrobiota bacterium]|nr:hypothetical protein [Verrucomicrobiota bacterium]